MYKAILRIKSAIIYQVLPIFPWEFGCTIGPSLYTEVLFGGLFSSSFYWSCNIGRNKIKWEQGKQSSPIKQTMLGLKYWVVAVSPPHYLIVHYFSFLFRMPLSFSSSNIILLFYPFSPLTKEGCFFLHLHILSHM